MKIAIHKSSGGFSERWMEYCRKEGIHFKEVNCYEDDIVNQLEDCDALLWHHHHGNYKDVLFAKELLYALEQSGMKVFPNFRTNWHFDDKIGQKYLLEAHKISMANASVFYDKNSAIDFLNKTDFPLVFKLRGGAGSANVKLINSKSQALRIVRKAFGKGFKQYSKIGFVKDELKGFAFSKKWMISFLKSVYNLIRVDPYIKMAGREKGYVYFQEFIPNNFSDIRVIVIGNKAFAIRRFVRKGDFRASGSGLIDFDPKSIEVEIIAESFKANSILKSQCVAFDFVYENNKPKIIEVSYGFAVSAYDQCKGYWDEDLNWIEGPFNPQEWMIQNLIKGN